MTVWPRGVLVRHGKGLFKALGAHNVAVPGDSHHSRFFVSIFVLEQFPFDLETKPSAKQVSVVLIGSANTRRIRLLIGFRSMFICRRVLSFNLLAEQDSVHS